MRTNYAVFSFFVGGSADICKDVESSLAYEIIECK